jgi:branched-chain amino acid transport system permease protein
MDWVNDVIQGILTGGLYALFACGLSLMFGVMKVVNLAHGDLAVLGGYVALGVIAITHVPVLWSFLIVVPIMAAIGYLLQRTLIQAALDRSILTTLLVTFGLSVVIENALLQFINADSHSLGVNNSIITASFSVGSQIQVAYLSLLILAVAVVVLLGLQYFLSVTKYGRLIRAVADDKEAAQLSGIDYRHVFGIAAAIAVGSVGLAGIAQGLSAQFPDHGNRHDPAVRVRGGGDRRARVAVGHACRRHRARRGSGDRQPDQFIRRVPRRVHRLPCRAGAQAAGPGRTWGVVMSEPWFAGERGNRV